MMGAMMIHYGVHSCKLHFLLVAVLFAGANCHAQQDTTFILLTNGNRHLGRVDFKAPFLRSPYILLNDSIRYELWDVRAYCDDEGYFLRLPQTYDRKSPTSPVFAKRIKKGRIDLFIHGSWHKTPSTPITVSTPVGSYTTGTESMMSYDKSEYFSKDGGDLIEADYDNLRIALADNTESMARLDQYRTLKIAQWSLYGGGAAIAAAGLLSMNGEKRKEIPVTVVVGAVVAASGWIASLFKEHQLDEAIDAYNR